MLRTRSCQAGSATLRPRTRVPSVSRPARSRHEATTVPAPCRVAMRPSASSRASEARRVSRLTPRASDSSRSEGNLVPGRRRPARMSPRSRSATASTTLWRVTGAIAARACTASGGEVVEDGGNESSAIVTPLLVEPLNLRSSSAQGCSLSLSLRRRFAGAFARVSPLSFRLERFRAQRAHLRAGHPALQVNLPLPTFMLSRGND